MTTNSARFYMCFVLMLCVACSGCGVAVVPTKGGTPGLVRTSSLQPLADVQVTICKLVGDTKTIHGVGVSRLDGRFELVLPDGKGPLWLEPGDYIVAAESVGSIPLAWEQPIGDPELTPLSVRWAGGGGELVIEIPDPISK